MASTDLSQRCFIDFLQSELLEVANVLFDARSNLSQEPVNCDGFNLCSSDLQVEDRNSLVVIVRNSLNPDLSGDNNLIEPMRTTLMIASYRWIVSFTLVMGFLAGTLVCAKSTGVQQKIPKRPGNMTVLTIGCHAAGRSYFGERETRGQGFCNGSSWGQQPLRYLLLRHRHRGVSIRSAMPIPVSPSSRNFFDAMATMPQ